MVVREQMKYLGSGKTVRMRTFDSKRLFLCQGGIPGNMPEEVQGKKPWQLPTFLIYICHTVAAVNNLKGGMAMPSTLKMIRDFMEKEGIPGRDAYELPTSRKMFPDGANYRIEIAGVERASTMEALIDEARKRNLVVHRVIAAVGGSTYCDFEELKSMAQMAREENIEVIMTVGHRKGFEYCQT